MKSLLKLTVFLLLFLPFFANGIGKKPYIRFTKASNFLPLAEKGFPVPMLISEDDFPGVLRAVGNLRNDFERVTGARPAILDGKKITSPVVLIAGTLGRHALIDELIRRRKLDVSAIRGKWEGFIITVVEKPIRGVDHALVIVGSDKRGTIFGLYDLASEIGVSPWAWWADIPVKKHPDIYFNNETQLKIPAVKYRGIFINDEQPALGGWVAQNYGGFNSKFYEKVFELILRQKGNFLWPAMWGQSFYTEDPESPRLADEMGVVIGTSHHEPMMRAHVEWQKNNRGPWNYNTNAPKLREFWKEGITRMGNNESIVTLAMRGDGDEPMSEESNVKLLEQIVADQRKILGETMAKDVREIPQVWALYKEVQEYYDKGMRVPGDVTLLLCDDNWGNIRKLPNLREKPHPGGYGIYYHFDYVGDPRNYKWLNTNPLPRIWEQMHLAWEYGAREIWIVNVGDIKPMEFPIEFFLDYAFDPSQWSEEELDDYTRAWAVRAFGDHGEQVARMVSLYTKFNGRRKPELLAPDSFSPRLYSLVNYNEASQIVEEYNSLAREAEELNNHLPEEYRDAFFQLVLYPVKACANLNELYYTVRLNRLYEPQQRAGTNALAEKARDLFAKDAALAKYYNETMSGGKWNHFMDQLRIGYRHWHDDFKVNTLPDLGSYTPVAFPAIGVSIEGSTAFWPGSENPLRLPEMNPYLKKNTFVEIYNRGTGDVEFSIQESPQLTVVPARGLVRDQQRISVGVNWDKVSENDREIPMVITSGDGKTITIQVPVSKLGAPVRGILESDGHVSIEAEHFTGKQERNVSWKVLPDHGRTLSAITAFPVTQPPAHADSLTDYVEYEIHFKSTGTFKVQTLFSPTIDFTAGDGLEFALSFDNDRPRILNLHAGATHRHWQESVKDNIITVVSEHRIDQPGKHTLKFWRVDPGVVLQKIVIDTGGLRESYLGPPETIVR